MQIQKQGNILLPQEFHQLTILTAVKCDHYFIRRTIKNFCDIFDVCFIAKELDIF